MKNTLLITLLFLALACKDAIEPPQTVLEDEIGEIEVFVCTRGCYQYLLEHQGTYYFPLHLPEEFHVAEKQVIFSGILQSDSTMVKKPAPNDAQMDDFKARNIAITSIREK